MSIIKFLSISWNPVIASINAREGASGGAVVEALRYKPLGRGIDSRWYHLNFSFT
jgi:hypothetical protein